MTRTTSSPPKIGSALAAASVGWEYSWMLSFLLCSSAVVPMVRAGRWMEAAAGAQAAAPELGRLCSSVTAGRLCTCISQCACRSHRVLCRCFTGAMHLTQQPKSDR